MQTAGAGDPGAFWWGMGGLLGQVRCWYPGTGARRALERGRADGPLVADFFQNRG